MYDSIRSFPQTQQPPIVAPRFKRIKRGSAARSERPSGATRGREGTTSVLLGRRQLRGPRHSALLGEALRVPFSSGGGAVGRAEVHNRRQPDRQSKRARRLRDSRWQRTKEAMTQQEGVVPSGRAGSGRAPCRGFFRLLFDVRSFKSNRKFPFNRSKVVVVVSFPDTLEDANQLGPVVSGTWRTAPQPTGRRGGEGQ